MENYLTRGELAARLGISVRTLARLAHQRKGPPYITVGRRARYRVDAVDKWLREIESVAPGKRA